MVGDHHTHAGGSCHLQHFVGGFDQLGAFTAHMGGDQTAELGNHLCQTDHFLGVGIASRGIDQTKGKAQRAGLHALTQQFLHLSLLFFRQLAVGIAHHAGPQVAVPHQIAHVGAGGLIHKVQIIAQIHAGAVAFFGMFPAHHTQAVLHAVGADGGGRFAAHTADDGGDALLQRVGAQEILLQLQIMVGVHVDKAGRQHLALAVDDGLGLSLQIFANPGDFAVFHRHIGKKGGISAAVGDFGVFDENIVHKQSLLKNTDTHLLYNTAQLISILWTEKDPPAFADGSAVLRFSPDGLPWLPRGGKHPSCRTCCSRKSRRRRDHPGNSCG